MNEIIKQMMFASYMAVKDGWPRCYLWSAVWWRWNSKKSRNPKDPVLYAKNQLRLYRDIKLNTDHYRRKRLYSGLTDWQIYCDRASGNVVDNN